MDNYKLTDIFGERKRPQKTAAQLEKERKWNMEAVEEEKKRRESNRLKRQTFKVGDKVKVKPFLVFEDYKTTVKGVITKLNRNYVYVFIKSWKEDKACGYEEVEKI
jgi:hypothetical protein